VTQSTQPTIAKVIVAAVLAWIVPGLGHIYAGERRRGLILMATIAVTFWTGVAIGGVQSTVKPRLWLIGQSCAGVHTVAAWTVGQWRASSYPMERFPSERADFLAEDVAVIYTGVAGMLNVLLIIDAIASTDPKYLRVGTRPPPRPVRPTEASS